MNLQDSIEIVKDPFNKFSNIADDDYLEMLGLLPHFVLNPTYAEKNLKDAMKEQYCYGGLFGNIEGTITDDGIYKSKYKSDPDLYPFIKIKRYDEIYYQYDYAIVAFVNDKETYITRMD